MAKIAINSTGSLGDLNPFTRLGTELKNRGHHVRFITIEAYRKTIEDLGFEFFPSRPDLSPENVDLAARVMDPEKGTNFLFKEVYLPNLRVNLRRCRCGGRRL